MAETEGNLKIVNMYLDPIQWEMLGQKVGDRNRSAWIRQKIEEELRIPDDIELLEEEEAKLGRHLKTITTKREALESKQESVRETKGDLKTRMKKAMRMVRKNLKEPTRLQKKHGYKGYEFGKDKIKEIAHRYDIDYDELEREIIGRIEVRLIAFHDNKIVQTEQTSDSYNG
jgi:hypothetical protein